MCACGLSFSLTKLLCFLLFPFLCFFWMRASELALSRICVCLCVCVIYSLQSRMSVSAALVSQRIFHFIHFGSINLFLLFSFDVLHDLLKSARRRRFEQRVVLGFFISQHANACHFSIWFSFILTQLCFWLRHFVNFIIETLCVQHFQGRFS